MRRPRQFHDDLPGSAECLLLFLRQSLPYRARSLRCSIAMPGAGSRWHGNHVDHSPGTVALLVPAAPTVPLDCEHCLRLRAAERADCPLPLGFGAFHRRAFLFEFALEPPASLKTCGIRACAMLSGAVPLLLYALSNHAWYGVWTPISGAAKQLRLHHSFSIATLQASFGPITLPYRLLIVYPALIVLLLCIASLAKPGRWQLRGSNLSVPVSLLLFPFLQLLAFSTLSDWPVWPWYLYSFPLAMTGGFLLFFNKSPHPRALVRKDVQILMQG